MAVTKRLRFEVLRRDNHTCRYCGATAPDVKLHVDHVLPVALGGTDEPANLVTACEPCNTGKSSIAPDETIVEDVASDALRWAKAIKLAAQQQAHRRAAAEELFAHFERRWNNWTYQLRGETCTIDKPTSWRQNVERFLDAGLPIDLQCELIDIAMEARVDDTWRYFCGCCWRRIRDLQENAKALIAAGAVNG